MPRECVGVGLEQNTINRKRLFCSIFFLVESLHAKTAAHFSLDALTHEWRE